tara:strand:+ start:856 stop:1308 length:453 start_codon:yes stop_codon:yes gene_type:complete
MDSHDDLLRMARHLAQSAQPAIVIAGGGMCSGGRIVNYLKAITSDPRHNVLFVGYQARGTPGDNIQRFGPRHGYVVLDGERIDIHAGVETIGGYSAHADQRELLSFITRMRRWSNANAAGPWRGERKGAIKGEADRGLPAKGLRRDYSDP